MFGHLLMWINVKLMVPVVYIVAINSLANFLAKTAE